MSRMLHALQQLDAQPADATTTASPANEPAIQAASQAQGSLPNGPATSAVDNASEEPVAQPQPASAPASQRDVATVPLEEIVFYDEGEDDAEDPWRTEADGCHEVALTEKAGQAAVDSSTRSSAATVDSTHDPELPDHDSATGTTSRRETELEQIVRDILSQERLARPYRELVERLRFQLPADKTLSCLLVSVDAHAKGWQILVHTAALLAEDGQQRVLMIDADLDRRALTCCLESGQATGLAEMMQQEKYQPDAILALATPGVHLLPAGNRILPGNLSGAFASELLCQLTQRFPVILVDAGHADTALAPLFGRCCDMTYLIVELGRTAIAEGSAAVTRLQNRGSRVLGCLVTDHRDRR